MAVGDVLAVKIKATAAGTIVFQPAAGVEYAITDLAMRVNGTANTDYGVYDGTDYVQLSPSLAAVNAFATGLGVIGGTNNPAATEKLFITNSVYLALRSGQTGDVLYIFGVQTK